MKSLRHIMVITLLVSFGFTIRAKEPDYSKLVAVGKEAVETIEGVQGRLAKMIRSFLEMMNDGKDNVSKEYWDSKVTPELMAGDKELSEACEQLLAVIPKNLNPRSYNPKDEPWTTVFDLTYTSEFVNLKKQNEIYDSEYIMLLIGAETYVQMYASCLHGRYEMLERDKNRLQLIIDDPAAYRQSRIDAAKKEEEERRAKEQAEKEEERNMPSLMKEPPKPNHTIDSYHSPFSYLGIPLGLEFHDFVNRLKSRGFKLEKQEIIKDSFYGYTPVAFMNGNREDSPVRVKIKASAASYRVFDVEATISNILDADEAWEVVARMAEEYAATHPNSEKEGPNEVGDVDFRDYSGPKSKENYLGLLSLSPVKDSGHGFFVLQRLYDYKVGRIADNESK